MTLVAEDEPTKKALGFATMCEGWAIGSIGFQKALVKDHKDFVATRHLGLKEARALKEQLLEDALEALLRKAKKSALTSPAPVSLNPGRSRSVRP